MELKEFIKETLIDITAGINDANELFKETRKTKQAVFFLGPGQNKKEGTGVHFDVALTTKAAKGIAGKAKGGIRILELSTGGESQSSKENVSRISFTVMISHYVG